jgi:hypothetical protein
MCIDLYTYEKVCVILVWLRSGLRATHRKPWGRAKVMYQLGTMPHPVRGCGYGDYGKGFP